MACKVGPIEGVASVGGRQPFYFGQPVVALTEVEQADCLEAAVTLEGYDFLDLPAQYVLSSVDMAVYPFEGGSITSQLRQTVGRPTLGVSGMWAAGVAFNLGCVVRTMQSSSTSPTGVAAVGLEVLMLVIVDGAE